MAGNEIFYHPGTAVNSYQPGGTNMFSKIYFDISRKYRTGPDVKPASLSVLYYIAY
jgi:hypothetical protein